MSVAFNKSNYAPGDAVVVQATLSQGGQPPIGEHTTGGSPITNALVQATITIPGSSTPQNIPLHHVGSGVYSGVFTNTTAVGSYRFSIQATGTTQMSATVDSFQRQVSQSVFVSSPVPPDNVAPACAVTAIIPGPPRRIQVTVQDLQSGLASIVVTKAINVTVSIPSFSAGSTGPVVVTGTKINQGQSSSVELRVTDIAGNSVVCDPLYTTISPLPATFALAQNYPNPFNPTTVIRYQLPEPRHVSIVVVDVLGRVVRTLVNEPHDAGVFEVPWDGKNDRGALVGTGVFFYRIQAGDFVDRKRMIFMK
jgi:hypothetical protein